jgi:hypothetical protein
MKTDQPIPTLPAVAILHGTDRHPCAPRAVKVTSVDKNRARIEAMTTTILRPGVILRPGQRDRVSLNRIEFGDLEAAKKKALKPKPSLPGKFYKVVARAFQGMIALYYRTPNEWTAHQIASKKADIIDIIRVEEITEAEYIDGKTLKKTKDRK